MDTQYRISGGTELFMKAFCYCVYGANFMIQLLTTWWGAGFFLSPLFMAVSLTFLAAWLFKNGVYITDPKIGGRFIFGWIISLIPIINLLYLKFSKTGLPQPGIVASISRIIDLSKEQDDIQAKGDVAASMKNKDGSYRNQRFSGRPSGRSNRYEEDNEVEDDDDEEYDKAA